MQFENLLPESQKIIFELKKIYENLVMKNSCNVLFKTKNLSPRDIFSHKIIFQDNRIISCYDEQDHDRRIIFNYIKGAYQICTQYLELHYFNLSFADAKKYVRIQNDLYSFLPLKNFFISIPKEEDRLYSSDKQYFTGASE